MTSDSDLLSDASQQTAVRYVLGRLSPEEARQFEESYIRDHDRFEVLEAVEDELIDAYVRGELPPHDRKDFETNFMVTPDRRSRVAFARALAERDAAVDSRRASRWPPLTALLSTAATLAVAAFLVLLYRRPLPERPVAPTEKQPTAQDPVRIPTDPPATPPVREDPLRGGSLLGRIEVTVATNGLRSVQILLREPGVHARYALELENAAAVSVWHSEPLTPQPAPDGSTTLLQTALPASVSSGTYFLLLKGVDTSGAEEVLEQHRLTVR